MHYAQRRTRANVIAPERHDFQVTRDFLLQIERCFVNGKRFFIHSEAGDGSTARFKPFRFETRTRKGKIRRRRALPVLESSNDKSTRIDWDRAKVEVRLKRD